MKWIGKHNIFDDLMIGGVLLTPPNPTYEYELTLPNNDGSSGQVLTTDGNGLLSWTTVSSGTTYTAGDGLDLSGNTFSTDLKANSGLVIDSTELSMDLGASNITGTLAIGDGGTGQTTAQAAIDALTQVSGASAGQRLTKDGSGNATWADATTGTTINGTTTNGVATYGGTNTIDIESTLTFSPNNLTIGGTSSGSINILTPNILTASHAGHRLNIINGQSGAGANVMGGQQTFWSGLGTGNRAAGMYSFLGAPADNLAGGTGRSRENIMFKIYAEATTVNSAFAVLYDINNVNNFFSTQVLANGATVLKTHDNSSHNADLTIAVDGAVSIASNDASNDITLDSAGEIELNADGGNIDFKDNTARLAKIDTDGLSFQDNTGAGIKFEGATNNANQTTLSVVDPTGTRTINLPNDSGTVALQERSIIVKNMGFYNTSTSAFYLPMLEYIAESTSVASYVSSFVAPYDGKVIKVGPGWSNNSSSKTSTYKFFKNKQSSTQTGTTATTASFTTTIPEVTPTDWTFSKGEPIHIQCTNSVSIQSVSMTVTIELDLTS